MSFNDKLLFFCLDFDRKDKCFEAKMLLLKTFAPERIFTPFSYFTEIKQSKLHFLNKMHECMNKCRE